MPVVLERMKAGQVHSPSPSFQLGHPKGSTEEGDPGSMPRVPQPGTAQVTGGNLPTWQQRGAGKGAGLASNLGMAKVQCDFPW